MFRQGVTIILKFSTAVFTYSLPPKYSLCWLQRHGLNSVPFSKDMISTLFFRRPSSERSHSMDSRSFLLLTLLLWVTLVPMYLLCHPPWLCFLAQPDANLLLWPHVLLLSCLCLPYALVFVVSPSRAPKLCFSSPIFGAGNFTECMEFVLANKEKTSYKINGFLSA